MSVCLPLSVSVFQIFKKRADKFPRNFSWFIEIKCRRERIKTSGKFWPLMCKNSENGAKLPISTKYAAEKRHGLRALACAGLWYDFGTGQSQPRALACGPGQPHWQHGQRALACGAILRNGTGPVHVGEQWRALGVQCNGWIKHLRAPQAREVTKRHRHEEEPVG